MTGQGPGFEPRRVAIIGCGLIGAKRAGALPPGYTLVAVHDVEPARAVALAAQARSEDVAVVATADDAAERAGPGGLAIVATQHDALAEQATVAASAGCHVLVEKPGARRAEELRPLAELAAASGLTVRVGYNHRFHPAVLAARELLQRGVHGDVLVIRARYGHGGRIGYEREWRADRTRSGGGELLDQGVHLVDLARHLGGPVTLRYAALSTHYWAMDVEDNAFLHLGLEGGGDAWLHASWTEWKNLFSFEITCRTAKLELTGLGGSYGPERLTVHELSERLGPPMITTKEWPPEDTSWAAELRDVAAAIEGRSGEGASLEDCRAVLEVVDQAYDA